MESSTDSESAETWSKFGDEAENHQKHAETTTASTVKAEDADHATVKSSQANESASPMAAQHKGAPEHEPGRPHTSLDSDQCEVTSEKDEEATVDVEGEMACIGFAIAKSACLLPQFRIEDNLNNAMMVPMLDACTAKELAALTTCMDNLFTLRPLRT